MKAILITLGILATLTACIPIKLNTCTEIPKIVDKVDWLVPYAGKDLCADVSLGFSLKAPKEKE